MVRRVRKGWGYMYLIKALVILSMAFSLFFTARAERPPLDADRIAMIDQLVEERMAAMRIPGIALALIDNGEIVHIRGFGTTKRDGAPITEDTRFLIGSISKPLFSLTLLDMVADGKLSLDDTIVQHIPSFQTRNATRSDTMTVRHLLSHRSGFSMLFGNRNHAANANGFERMSTILDDARRTSLRAQPGAQFEYSNANYQLLGYLIEKIEGAPLEDVFAARLTSKFGIEATQLGLSPASDLSAVGHRYWLGTPRPHRWAPERLHWAQGGVESTVSDLASILVRLMDELDPAASNPLWQSILAAPPTVPEASNYYGLGWFVRQSPAPIIALHSGLNPGFEALAGFSPDEKFGFVILANASSSYGARDLPSLHYGVYELLLGLPVRSMEISPQMRAVRITALSLPVLILIWIASFIWKLRRQAFTPLSWQPVTIGWRVIGPTLLLAMVAYALVFIAPALNNASFVSVYVFQPDLGIALGLGAALAGLWAIVRFGLRVSVANRS
ncbi:MAG: serine hydrolase domain-containing protein [Pseudomonadota bacterium]